MKQIIAYIQPFMADKVKDALRNAGVHGGTVVPCTGFGRQVQPPGTGIRYEEPGDTLGFVAKTKLEIVCTAGDKDRIVANDPRARPHGASRGRQDLRVHGGRGGGHPHGGQWPGCDLTRPCANPTSWLRAQQ